VNEHRAYWTLAGYSAIALLLAGVLDVAMEWNRASSALAQWICATAPTPSGPQACQAAFVARWMTSRLPLYMVAVGVAWVAATLLWIVRARSTRAPWTPLGRVAVAVACLVALAELVACSGDATCGLSVSCA
jgi:hypothetical protein